MNEIYTSCLSDSLVQAWKKLLVRVYGYKEYDNFLIVPNIIGQKTFSHLPLLNYTNKTGLYLPELLKNVENFSYQLRLLNPSYREFKKEDTVVMRIPLYKKSSEEVWKTILSNNMKKQLKKSFRVNLTIQKGNNKELIYIFYMLFSQTMKKFGTPIFGVELFLRIPEFTNSLYYVVFYQNQPVAAMLLIFDSDIVWCPYSGSDERYSELRPGHFMFWNGIKDSCDLSKLLFDFGRSAYGNNNFYFKERWSAVPVKIDIITPKKENIYNKYKFAAKIYKNLPNSILNQIGPFLCKRLPDL